MYWVLVHCHNYQNISLIWCMEMTKVTDVQCQKFKGCVRGICEFSYPTNPLGGRMLSALKIDRAPEPGFGHGQGLPFPISSLPQTR